MQNVMRKMKFTEENLLDIALIFEQANGNVLNSGDVAIVNNSGFIQFTPEELESMLIDSIADSEPEQRSRVYWVLGKRYNHNLLPKFKDWLKLEVATDNVQVIYQLLIALDNLEEPVFGKDRDGSYSSLDTELNIRDANVYLNKNA